MPINKAGRFTYQKQYSQWDVVKAQRQFHAAKSRNYLNSGAEALSALLTTFDNQITGTGNLTAKAALTRIQNATQLARFAAKGINISI